MTAALDFAVLERSDEEASEFLACAVERIGARVDDFLWPSITLRAGETRIITAPGDGLARQSIATENLNEFKNWIQAGESESWQRSLRALSSPYTLDIVTADVIRLERRSKLILSGRPVLFIANRIEFAGGQFISTVDGFYAIAEVRHLIPRKRRSR